MSKKGLSMMGESYSAIARVYDRLNAEIDYEAWADFVMENVRRHADISPSIALDLACGTGSMTAALARRGLDMIGIDLSAEMLSEALMREGSEKILFLKQDMRTFELYGTVGLVTSCLDSMNYLLTEEDFVKTVRNVRLYLEPGGLFLFDMNTPYKFEHIYADNAYILEDEIAFEDEIGTSLVYCGWQNEYHRDSGLCDFYLSLFTEGEDGSYFREDEHQTERMYSFETVKRILEENGFELVGCFMGYDFEAPKEETERWYFTAKAVLGNTEQQIVTPCGQEGQGIK